MLSDRLNAKEALDGQTFQERPSNHTTIFTTLASALLDDWLSEMTPTQHACSNAVPWRIRKLCGRWLAVRRLQLKVTTEVIADRGGVDAETLRLLELGLAGDDLVDDERWSNVAMLLADGERDADFVMVVLRAALGRINPGAEQVLDQVQHDLQAIVMRVETTHDIG